VVTDRNAFILSLVILRDCAVREGDGLIAHMYDRSITRFIAEELQKKLRGMLE
jgi:hypothetical protein